MDLVLIITTKLMSGSLHAVILNEKSYRMIMAKLTTVRSLHAIILNEKL